jgi:hypothetical protein
MKFIKVIVPMLVGLGCAGDPNKELKSAENEVNKSEVRSDNAQAETSAKNQENRLDTAAGGKKDALEARANLEEARIKMAKEREAFNIDGEARYKKAEARAADAKLKGAKLTGKKSAEYKTAWVSYENAKVEASARWKAVTSASDADWSNERAAADRALALMEKSADSALSP